MFIFDNFNFRFFPINKGYINSALFSNLNKGSEKFTAADKAKDNIKLPIGVIPIISEREEEIDSVFEFKEDKPICCNSK